MKNPFKRDYPFKFPSYSNFIFDHFSTHLAIVIGLIAFVDIGYLLASHSKVAFGLSFLAVKYGIVVFSLINRVKEVKELLSLLVIIGMGLPLEFMGSEISQFGLTYSLTRLIIVGFVSFSFLGIDRVKSLIAILCLLLLHLILFMTFVFPLYQGAFFFASDMNKVIIVIILFLGIILFMGRRVNDFYEKWYKDFNDIKERLNSREEYIITLEKDEKVPKLFYFANLTVLYMDIAGIADYFQLNNKLESLNPIFENFFKEVKSYCYAHRIYFEVKNKECFFWIRESPVGSIPDYSIPLVDMAMHIQNVMRNITVKENVRLETRIGIASGKYYKYDLNDTFFKIDFDQAPFHEAKRMEKYGVNNEIQVNEATFKLLNQHYHFVQRNGMDLYLLVARL